MGTKLSVSLEGAYQPDIAPRTDRPATFDPQYGFEKLRKVREMKATWEEMEQWKLKPGQRDYCAHLLIPLMKCQASFLFLQIMNFRLKMLLLLVTPVTESEAPGISANTTTI